MTMSRRPTYAQLERMIEFLEETPQLAKGQMRCNLGRHETMLKWEELATMLNSMEGLKKTAKQWARFWADKKYSLKRRQVAMRNATEYRLRYNLDDDAPPLSDLDDRILLLVGGKKSDLSKKKKETIVKPKELPKPSTSRARSTNTSQNAANTKLRRSPRIMVRNLRSHVIQERQRLINIEEKRVHAETVQATGWYKAAKALKYLARSVVRCGQIIADAVINRGV